ncbi:MAG: excinuclease ABC subunit UvrC [Phycisphaerales bacterium]
MPASDGQRGPDKPNPRDSKRSAPRSADSTDDAFARPLDEVPEADGGFELDDEHETEVDASAAEVSTDARLGRLLAKARTLPKVPGVYLMKDQDGHVVYVGKARTLPNRVASYFVPSTDLGFRKQPLVEVVEDFDVIPCEGEWEALLLESRLIKDTRPRFNAKLVDDKTFPYLVVTMRDEFPGVYITREPTDERFKGARIFGPFTSVASLRHALQLMQRVFQFRTCELEIRSDDPKNRHFRPCLLHAIRQCTAPCANRVTPERYRADIERFLRFLHGKRSQMLRELKDEMDVAAKTLKFETAAALRDQIKAIEKLDDREKRSGSVEYDWQPEVTIFAGDPAAGVRSLQRALGLDTAVRCMEAIDIAHLGGGETVGSKVCFIDGRPFKDGYRRYRVRSVANDDYMAIREVVSRRYRDAGAGQELYPDVILIDGGLGQLHAALEAFAELGVQPPMVISLAKKEELIYVQRATEPIRLSREHLGLRLCQAIRDEAHRFAQHYHHLLRTKRVVSDEIVPLKRGRRSKRSATDDPTKPEDGGA